MSGTVKEARFYAPEAKIFSAVLALVLLIFGFDVWRTIMAPRLASWSDTSSRCWLDHVQNYSMTRAVLAGEDPYRPVGEIFSRFFPAVSCLEEPVMVPQPSPYPPASILLHLPFVRAASTLDQSALLWSCFSLLLLVVTIWRYVAGYDLSPLRAFFITIISFSCVLGATSIYQDLWLGNMQTFILCIVIEMIGAFRRGEEMSAGILLGVLLAVKVTGIPLLVFLILQWRLRAVVAALATTAILTLSAGIFFGFEMLKAYPQAIEATLNIFGHQSINLSFLLIGHRLFGSLSAAPDPVDIFGVAQLVPLFSFHFTSLVCDWIGRLAALITILFFCSRKRTPEVSAAVMIAIVALTQPVVWYYTQSLALPAAGLLLIQLFQNSIPLWKRLLGWVAVYAVAIPPTRWLMEFGYASLSPFGSSAAYLCDSLTVFYLLTVILMVIPSSSKPTP